MLKIEKAKLLDGYSVFAGVTLLGHMARLPNENGWQFTFTRTAEIHNFDEDQIIIALHEIRSAILRDLLGDVL